jgi:hypothetical protein
LTPVQTQVLPSGVLGDDELDLFDPKPAFDFSFAGYGLCNAFEAFIVDQLVDIVTRGVCGYIEGLFVLFDAMLQSCRDACVEAFEGAGEYVDVGLIRCHFGDSLAWAEVNRRQIKQAKTTAKAKCGDSSLRSE